MTKRTKKKADKSLSKSRVKMKTTKAVRKTAKTIKVGKKPSARLKKPQLRARNGKKKSITRRPASKKASRRPGPVSPNESKLVPVPLPEGVRTERIGETTERSAHLEKLKLLFESAPISHYLRMTLGYCENGVARVRLPFRAEFDEGHGVIHGGLIGLLGDTAGNFAVGSVSPGSTVKTVEFKLSLLASVQGDLLAIGEVVRKGRTLATCRLEVVEGNDRVVAIGLATYALQAI